MTPLGRYRVKLVMPSGPDSHYFYAQTMEEAQAMLGELTQALSGHSFSAYVYVETPLGHVRIS